MTLISDKDSVTVIQEPWQIESFNLGDVGYVLETSEINYDADTPQVGQTSISYVVYREIPMNKYPGTISKPARPQR